MRGKDKVTKWNVLSAWRNLLLKLGPTTWASLRRKVPLKSKIPPHLLRGAKAESLAQAFLRRKGHKIIATNFKTKYGEIDIISKFKGFIVFTEVKSGTKSTYFHPRDKVDAKKKAKLANTAAIFLRKNRLMNAKTRFGIIEVNFRNSEDNKPEIIYAVIYHD